MIPSHRRTSAAFRKARRILVPTLERCEDRQLLAAMAFSVVSDWGSGFQGQVAIKNDQSSAVRSWTLGFDFAHDIESIWGAQIVSHMGTHYVVQNVSYDGVIDPGGTVSFGFVGSPGKVSDRPLGYVFSNGGVNPPPSVLANATVNFSVVNNWGSGFQANVKVANPGPGDINGWALAFDAPFNITQIWNADILSHVGNHYVLANEDCTVTIPAGSSVDFGFTATPGGTVAKPMNYALNGVSLNQNGVVVPAASVADIAVADNPGANVNATFTVSLSPAPTKAASVAYATADGTAKAGTDYVAANGIINFAPGQSTQTVTVAVKPVSGAATSRSFSLALSSPNGLTLAKSSATATISYPLETADVSVANTLALVGANSAPVGYLHTSGNQILDANNQPVKIAGVNWFGMETTTYAPDGLWTRNYKDMMDQMKSLGFNAIRLPFSDQLFDANSKPQGINYNINPDLVGLNGLGIMDKVVAYAGQIGLRIFLDHHHSEAGSGAEASGLWYSSAYPESRWISDWTMLAQHYANNPTVIGGDLDNEPHGPADWGNGDANDWRLAAERAGDAILAVNPNWLVIVEGVEQGKSGFDWWGGNLSNAGQFPVVLNVPNRLVYSPHDYPASIYPQSWFSAPNYPSNLYSVWDANWGYLYRQNIAPVLLGEFGSKLQTTSDQQWASTMVNYLSGDLNGDGKSDLSPGQKGMSWTWWSWNPNSGDTGGILNDDWTTANTTKVNLLKPIEAPLTGTNAVAAFTLTLSAPIDHAVTVDYSTADGTAKAGTDYVATSGTATFGPGVTSVTIYVPILGGISNAPDETFELDLLRATGLNIKVGKGTATIRRHG